MKIIIAIVVLQVAKHAVKARMQMPVFPAMMDLF